MSHVALLEDIYDDAFPIIIDTHVLIVETGRGLKAARAMVSNLSPGFVRAQAAEAERADESAVPQYIDWILKVGSPSEGNTYSPLDELAVSVTGLQSFLYESLYGFAGIHHGRLPMPSQIFSEGTRGW